MLALLRRYTWDEWQAIHAEHAPADPRRLDWRPLVILVVATVSLTLQYYWGDRDTFARLWPRPNDATWLRSDYELGYYFGPFEELKRVLARARDEQLGMLVWIG